jgi:type I restriction enzyme S subunit
MHASSDEVIEYTTRLSNGARMPRASWNDLAAYPIALPPAAILKAFNETITPMFARMAGNIALARNLSALRDSLLQRMVCGQLAIPAETHDQEEATA